MSNLYNLKKGVAQITDLTELTTDITGDVTMTAAGVTSIAALVIVNADVNASAAIAGSKLATNARRLWAKSQEFDVDNGTATTEDDVILVPTDGVTLLDAKVVYTEATPGTSGAEGATVKLGSAVGGAQYVAATSLSTSAAVGGTDGLTLVTPTVPAAGVIFVRHTGVASGTVGKYFVQLELSVDD